MTELHIAIVDDDPAYCMLLQTILDPLLDVASVTVFHDGREFLAAHQQQHFDLVLLDLHMPAMDGHEVLAALRDGQGSSTPVVVLSSSTVQADVEDAYSRGARGYLVKPADIDELEDLLEDLVAMWSRMALPARSMTA